MRCRVCIVLTVLAATPSRGAAQSGAAATVSDSAAARTSRQWHVSYVAGYRDAGSNWGPAEHQVIFGIVDADVRPASWPVALATRMALAYTPAVPPGSRPDAGASGSYEISLGARRDLFSSRAPGATRVWLGGGLDILGASIRSKEILPGTVEHAWEDHDATLGPYVEAGVERRLRGRVFVGLAGTWSRGRVRPAAQELDAGGFQLLLLVGGRGG